MTIADAVNRGFNLLICAILGLIGLAFGTLLIGEADPPDKIDDGGLLLVGIIAAVWYLMGRNRFSRSRLPWVFIGLAALAQIAGDIIERSDPTAIGDNIGGSVLVVGLVVLAAVQWRNTGRLLAASPSSSS